MTDISADVQYYLQHAPEIEELVTEPYIGVDEAYSNGWIFDSNLKVRLQNTQRCAIVISYGGGYRGFRLKPDTAGYPLCIVDIWADPTRNDDFSVKTDDAKAKCFVIYTALKKVLNHPMNDMGAPLYFDQTRITSSEIFGEPVLSWVENGNGARMLRSTLAFTDY